MSLFDAYVIEEQQQRELENAWAEYRANGGKLDFIQWQEKLERESNA